MLEITIAFSLLLKKYPDATIIAFLLTMNALTGFYLERQASRVVESLKRKLNVKARVRRDGFWQMISARDLVPGDVERVRTGDFVPADAKVIEENVEADQSALTGESLTVRRKPGRSPRISSV